MRRLMMLLALVPALAAAAPDRAGLIQAWEAAMRRDGTLAARPDGSYRYRSESIGYDGGVRIVSAIVRADDVESSGQPDMAAMGTVDFDLVDLPSASKDSAASGIAMWKAQRQSFVYDGAKQSWQTAAEWAKARYRAGRGAPTRWLLDYALPIGLIALLVAAFWGAFRIQWRANRQLRESSDLNRSGRENLDRAAQMQEAQQARFEESLALARRNTALLEAILDELRKRPQI